VKLEIEAYLQSSKAAKVAHSLLELTSELRPTSFSSGETGKRGKIPNAASFREFLVKNSYGYFLFAEKARYNLFLTPHGKFSKVVVDSLEDTLTESDAVIILKNVADCGLAFGFAAHPDEYEHRNRYVRRLGAAQFETWIGRDLSMYLPGVYWLTVFSEEYRSIIPNPPTLLSDTATVTQLNSGHWLVKAFPFPNDWTRYARSLDEWCAQQPSVFSKKRIKAQLDAAPDLATLSQLAGQWP
jgi:hypothetical protein